MPGTQAEQARAVRAYLGSKDLLGRIEIFSLPQVAHLHGAGEAQIGERYGDGGRFRRVAY